MAEYIEREATCKGCVRYGMGETLCADCVVKVAPAADVAPVAHGRWVDNTDENGLLRNAWRKCSACGCLNYSKRPPYCPNCGAKMQGGSDE